MAEVLDRWPSAGLAGGVVRDGSLAWFLGHGVAEIEFEEPVNEDTVFRIGSVPKTFTAIAVVQLCEEGLVDLDAPANDYLRSLRMAIANRIAAASLGGSRLGPAGFHGPGKGPRSLDGPTHRT